MTPYLAVLALMAVLILILAGWRQLIDLHEDDSIHLHENETGLVKAQVELAGKIRSIDRAGKAITIAAASTVWPWRVGRSIGSGSNQPGCE